MQLDSWNSDGGKIAAKVMYQHCLDNGLYDEADKFIKDNKEDYYSYMSDVVTILAKNKQKTEARKFIERKISYFFPIDEDKESSSYKEYNSKLVRKKLNAIINNM